MDLRGGGGYRKILERNRGQKALNVMYKLKKELKGVILY